MCNSLASVSLATKDAWLNYESGNLVSVDAQTVYFPVIVVKVTIYSVSH